MNLIQITQKPGKTITERFKAYDGNLSRKEIIQFLSIENASALARMGLDGSLTAEQELEYLDFYHYFSDLYANDEKLTSMMFENWGDLPLVIRIGMVVESRNSFPYNHDVKLSPQQEKWRDSFVKHLFSYRIDRTLSFHLDHPDGASSANEIFCFPRTIPHKDLLSAKETAGLWFSYAMQFGGLLILRFHGMGDAGKDIVSGYFFRDGEIQGIPAEGMQITNELMDDGSMQPDPTAEYRTPSWLP